MQDSVHQVVLVIGFLYIRSITFVRYATYFFNFVNESLQCFCVLTRHSMPKIQWIDWKITSSKLGAQLSKSEWKSENSLRWRNCPTNLWSAVRMPRKKWTDFGMLPGWLPFGYIPKMNYWSRILLIAIWFVEHLIHCFDSWTFDVPVQLYKPLCP